MEVKVVVAVETNTNTFAGSLPIAQQGGLGSLLHAAYKSVMYKYRYFPLAVLIVSVFYAQSVFAGQKDENERGKCRPIKGYLEYRILVDNIENKLEEAGIGLYVYKLPARFRDKPKFSYDARGCHILLWPNEKNIGKTFGAKVYISMTTFKVREIEEIRPSRDIGR